MSSYLPSLGIGAVAGMRTMTASAALSWAAPGWIGPSISRAGHARPALAATLLALGEIVGDKLPFAPDRRIPPSLAVRLAIGGAGGAALVGRSGSPLTGAAYGVVGALIGTFGGRAARALTARIGLNGVGGLIEDAVAIGLAVAAVRLAQEGRRSPALT